LGIICRVPGLGYYVSASFALAIAKALADGSLTAVPSAAADRRAGYNDRRAGEAR
jgi:hypothetical protein